MAPSGAPVPPGSVIGILGGGQLGRMIALAAAPLGYRCAVLTPEADSPASQVAWRTVVAPYDDAEALARFADLSDVVTLEFENVPAATVAALAARVRTAPRDRVLAVTQDRLKEKIFAQEAELETVAFAAVDSGDLSAMTDTVGFPAILKTRRLGYDGKGQRRVANLEEARQACRALGGSLIAEAVCPFDKELSAIVARSEGGDVRSFDAVENEHENHILRTTMAPARVPDAVRREAEAAACRLAERLSLVGLLAVEFFWSPQDGLLVNEMAPRPHNSGHWTIEACRTGQFEQLVRAICGLPLGDPGRRFDAVMTNLLGAEADDWAGLTADPAVHMHLYGKAEARAGRKMGHVTRLLPLGAHGADSRN
ncbi:MAG: 5-(carboxyamino)imidazole ribonucleotide synthase [Rhodospirillaceae bacterium]|nr:5-(carboxyamino)imidazole ribonucleotide synthase [Rhodospirillaceae bacterium]